MDNETDLDLYVYPGKRFAKNGLRLGDGQGMSLRDYFAGQALAGMLAFDGYVKPASETRPTREVFANSAYELADAMLAERADG